ncbi:MAG TPA: 23S rRNA (guanosine(2251)-2'-O)-methyltransferase RlmB [Acidimicrobiales bacterium]|nr:23S rRNA (guanosine(2251)-2'-O)-methyltransferase RlmB [Acidimicrobiales bacterium]
MSPQPHRPRRGGAGRPPPAARPAARTGLGGEQVEGRRAVRELLRARRRRIKDVWLSDTAAPDHPVVAEILDLVREQRIPLREVARGRLDAEATSEAPQGVLAHAEPLPEVDLDRLSQRVPGSPPPFLVVLDGVTDPQNLGAILRTADSAGATGVVLGRHRSVHVTPTVAKASAGAIEHVPIALVAGIPAALQSLGAAGVWTIGLDGDADQFVFDLDLATEAVALVLGAEGSGLSRLVRARCDVLAAIPQRGALASLNVGAAAAVACFDVARRRLA